MLSLRSYWDRLRVSSYCQDVFETRKRCRRFTQHFLLPLILNQFTKIWNFKINKIKIDRIPSVKNIKQLLKDLKILHENWINRSSNEKLKNVSRESQNAAFGGISRNFTKILSLFHFYASWRTESGRTTAIVLPEPAHLLYYITQKFIHHARPLALLALTLQVLHLSILHTLIFVLFFFFRFL